MSRAVDDYLNEVNYEELEDGYIPSEFAIQYVNFIKLVNGEEGESNITPTVHYRWLDQLAGDKRRLANLCSRGFGKTVIFGEYLVLYLAVFGDIPGFGLVNGMIYVSDSMENGAKSLRKNVEHRYYSSEFLQQYLPVAKFTDAMLEFENKSGHKLGVRLFGAKTGLRGTKIYGKRPTLAILDDLVSDSDANSPTVMRAIKDTVYKGVLHALDPTKQKTIFSGTPFNKSDILYEAVESGAWEVNVYPICEKFPCSREEFSGAWEDRFSYDYVNDQYLAAVATGELSSFMQELMLRISNEEDMLLQDSDLMWYSRNSLIHNKGNYNFYITTDFATSEKQSADYSVLSVWAINNKGYWFLVDGVCQRQTMDKNIDDLFRLAQMYKPKSVGVEVTGQQGGFIQWIQKEMLERDIWFSLASEGNNGKLGIRPNTNKLVRFQTVVPWFKAKRMFFPEEMRGETALLIEAEEELKYATKTGFKSRADDFIDTVSMLSVMNAWKPSHESRLVKETESDIWSDDIDDDGEAGFTSYVV